MKLSKRKITARKVRLARSSRLLRKLRKDLYAFQRILFPNMLKPIYGNVQPKGNPFIYAEGISKEHMVLASYPRYAGRTTLKSMLACKMVVEA